MSPPLALGQAVHEVIESLSQIPTKDRFQTPLIDKFELSWSKLSGKNGGFTDKETELSYKKRGQSMIKRVHDNPGPLKNLAVKINMDLPHYWLSEEEGIILCGKIDWLEYMPEVDGVHIIDFKTSKREEDPQSLQLPIYHLLVHNCQNRKAHKASYWYLELSHELKTKRLPDLEEAHAKVLKIAKKIKLARQLKLFKCPNKTGCFACKPLEKVLNREAEFVKVNDFGQDVYIFPAKEPLSPEETSTLL
jgi:hypothetical protein